MLPKKKRLTRAIFKPLWVSTRVFQSPHFSLKIAPAESVRAGVSVSKKIAKTAVVRNRIRRRVYALLAALISPLPPALYHLAAKPGAEKLTSGALSREIRALFDGIKV